MSAESVVVQQLMDRLQQGTVASQPDLLAQDLAIHVAERPVTGREAVLLLVRTTYDAFRDVHLQYQIVSQSPGVVVAMFEARGIEQHELFGFRPNGHEVSLNGIAVFRFSGSAISQVQVFGDMANLFRPAPSVAEAVPSGATVVRAPTTRAGESSGRAASTALPPRAALATS
jgi:hypothetical protein